MSHLSPRKMPQGKSHRRTSLSPCRIVPEQPESPTSIKHLPDCANGPGENCPRYTWLEPRRPPRLESVARSFHSASSLCRALPCCCYKAAEDEAARDGLPR